VTSGGLSIIIVNFRTPALTVDCLRSLASEVPTVAAARVYIVENGSGDDSTRHLAAAIADNGWSAWATLVPLPHNCGFAGGNNRGIAFARARDGDPRYWLLLNSDTVVHPGCLRYCCQVLDHEPTIGLLSCLVLNRDGSWQNVTRRFPTPLAQAISSLGLPWFWPRAFGWANVSDVSESIGRTKRDVDWIGGSVMFVRDQAMRQLGPLDEDFFFYGEDVELCFRYNKAGWRVHFDPGASITHLGGSSSDATKLPSRSRSTYQWRARYLLQRKCYGQAAALFVRGVDLLSHSARYLVQWLTGRRHTVECQYHRQAISILIRPLRALRPNGGA
jgi:GT2 family glycosyltransferase